MTRSRLFTLVCILAMLLGLVAAAAANRVGREQREAPPPEVWPAAGTTPQRSAPPVQPTSRAPNLAGDDWRG
jgi:hypothetical protein